MKTPTCGVDDVADPDSLCHNTAMAQRIAFFDLDKTLIDVNSAKLWVRSEFRRGHIKWWMALSAMFWTVMYGLGWTRMERLLIQGIRWLNGRDVDVIVARTEAFYVDEVRHRFRPGALEALRAHREAGDILALCTSSSSILSHYVAHELDIPHILANGFEHNAGVFTGKPDPQQLCYGKGKLTHASALAERLGVHLDDCAFYTDSVSDLALLEHVGEPVCVHPDRRLRRIADNRGWQVSDWGVSGEPLALPAPDALDDAKEKAGNGDKSWTGVLERS